MSTPTAIQNRSTARHASPSRSSEVEQAARQRVEDHCPYRYYFKNVDYRFGEGVLSLRGRVHSFYLKQILQAVLADLPEVDRIDNRVEVISSVGLSSVRPR